MRIKYPQNGKHLKDNQHPIIITGDKGEVFRISVLEEDIIRVQHLPDGAPRLDRTWMILGTQGQSTYLQPDVPIEGRQRDDYSRFTAPGFELTTNSGLLSLQTQKIRLQISPEDFRLQWFDAQSGVCFATDRDRQPYPYDIQSKAVYHYKNRFENEYYYGFGERAGSLAKNGQRMKMFNMDAMGYDAESSDPLYKHFPIYITYNPELKIAYGLIYDNLATSIFDMGCEIDNYHGPYNYYQAAGGDIDYYMIYGPSIPEVVGKIATLTGRTALPPKWSLGYLGSTMTYTDAPDAQVQLKKFIDLCEKHDIPCDMFHLSSGYSMDNDGFRYVFEWNHDRVPDPKQMSADFHQNGIKLTANIKPALLTTHPSYAALKDNGCYIKEADSENPELVHFWGGMGAHLDFTNPQTHLWWKKMVKERLLDYDIDATWNDNNEFPLLDDEARCAGFGEDIPIGLIRPLQTMLMTRVSKEAQVEHDDHTRPFLLCRSGCPGIQRYAQTWSGDNYTAWDSIKFNTPMGLGLGLSGAPNTGHDIGGFAGPRPDAELFVRWVEQGIFMPRFTIHSWNDDGTVNEPWMFPEVLPIIREQIKFRYRLMPTLYSLFHQTALTGEPLIRPMVYAFPNDPNCHTESFDFMLGENILVASIFEPGQREREVYLPAGANWYNHHTDETFTGGQKVTVNAPLENIPLFIRAGGMIAMGNAMQHVGAETDDLRQIHIYPHLGEGSSEYTLYEDDGATMNYTAGEVTEIKFKLETTSAKIDITVEKIQSGYPLPYKEIQFILPSADQREVNINQRPHKKITDKFTFQL